MLTCFVWPLASRAVFPPAGHVCVFFPHLKSVTCSAGFKNICGSFGLGAFQVFAEVVGLFTLREREVVLQRRGRSIDQTWPAVTGLIARVV